MNDEAQKAVADILEQISEGMAAVSSSGVDQIPDVLEQLLLWHTIYSLGYTTIGFIIFTIGAYPLAWALVKYKKKKDGDYLMLSGGIFVFFTSMTSLLAWFISDFAWLKIMIAPKLYILEYAASLVK